MSTTNSAGSGYKQEDYLNKEELIPYFPSQLFDKSCVLRELPFNPWTEHGGDITRSFLESLMSLPGELRNKIYEYILCAGGPKTDHEFTYAGPNPHGAFKLFLPTYRKPDQSMDKIFQYTFAMTSKDDFPMLQSELFKSSMWSIIHSGFWRDRRSLFECFESSSFESPTFDPPRYYDNILRYIYSIATIENLSIDEKGIWASKEGEHGTAALRDILFWFWNETVLEVGDSSMKWLHTDSKLFEYIQSISIDIRALGDQTFAGWEPQRGDLRDRTTLLFNNINKNFPNIQKLTVWANMTVPEIENALNNPGSQRWITALWKVVVGKKFDFQLLIAFWHPHDSYRCPELSATKMDCLHMEWQDRLRVILMPASLSVGTTNDLPEDLGLKSLFREDI